MKYKYIMGSYKALIFSLEATLWYQLSVQFLSDKMLHENKIFWYEFWNKSKSLIVLSVRDFFFSC